MNSKELVAKTIKGENPGRTPVYGWVSANLYNELTESFGSVENFEDKYEFDMTHVFGGPQSFDMQKLLERQEKKEIISVEEILDTKMNDVDDEAKYEDVKRSLKFHSDDRQRFCYMQTPGIFEHFNGVFGIEEHMINMMLYHEEMNELYKRQAEWNSKFASNILDLGMDMIHVSDDWGAQRSLLFSYDMWKEMIYPNHIKTAQMVKKKGGFLSLHSDGNINDVLDGIVDIGYDVVHPWQEAAGMSYDTYLEKYQDKFAILGGLCIQNTLGFGDYENLEKEIRKVFGLLKGKRWMFCTTHYVQNHCSIDELVFAYDLATKLARG